MTATTALQQSHNGLQAVEAATIVIAPVGVYQILGENVIHVPYLPTFIEPVMDEIRRILKRVGMAVVEFRLPLERSVENFFISQLIGMITFYLEREDRTVLDLHITIV